MFVHVWLVWRIRTLKYQAVHAYCTLKLGLFARNKPFSMLPLIQDCCHLITRASRIDSSERQDPFSGTRRFVRMGNGGGSRRRPKSTRYRVSHNMHTCARPEITPSSHKFWQMWGLTFVANYIHWSTCGEKWGVFPLSCLNMVARWGG